MHSSRGRPVALLERCEGLVGERAEGGERAEQHWSSARESWQALLVWLDLPAFIGLIISAFTVGVVLLIGYNRHVSRWNGMLLLGGYATFVYLLLP